MTRVEIIRLTKKIGIVSPWPAIMVEDLDMLVVSDLHLGLEDERESMGIHIPRTVFSKVLEYILTPVKELGCRGLLIVGDVKHEFGKPSEAEWWAVKRLFRRLRDAGCEPKVVRGNHDNYIITVLKELDVAFYDPSITYNSVLFKHGHEVLNEDEVKAEHLIMGHEHPVVSIKDDVGLKHRFKAFLHGRLTGRKLTVLPSVSPLAYGTDVNETHPDSRLSPILRGLHLGEAYPFIIEPGVAVKRFPKLKYL